jgi:spore coat polysaccharide biosynthesis predicted glycosyltransferase SpsG/RimJ/RimL family protein N-acetyltransferase
MVIDDLASRRHDCDVLLDQNFSAEGNERYKDLVPGSCKLLTGPRYALLRPEYADYRKCLRARDGRVTRVLVFMGGSDPDNLTGMALKALSAPEIEHLNVDVVVGPSNPHANEIASLAKLAPNTTVHCPRPHLADLMASADLAIGAGGATTWERMCLGLPAVVISIANNQRPACGELQEAGLVRYIGHASDVCAELLTAALLELKDKTEKVRVMSESGMAAVDGMGTNRLVEVLMPTKQQELWLREAQPADVVFYFDWVNECDVRKQSFSTKPISFKAHKNWFRERLSDPDSFLFVLEAGELPVGQVRFECRDDVAYIDYSLDRAVRGRGWGSKLVRMGIRCLWGARSISIRAKVKANNAASRKVFAGLGFAQVDEGGGVCTYALAPN